MKYGIGDLAQTDKEIIRGKIFHLVYAFIHLADILVHVLQLFPVKPERAARRAEIYYDIRIVEETDFFHGHVGAFPAFDDRLLFGVGMGVIGTELDIAAAFFKQVVELVAVKPHPVAGPANDDLLALPCFFYEVFPAPGTYHLPPLPEPLC